MKRIAILSGKGGVGKSTVSWNLALSLTELGYNIGLLDADIHGPNIPQVAQLPPELEMDIKNDRIIPIEFKGIKLVSLAFSIPDEAPVLWHGSQKRDVIEQLIRLSVWGDELDYLIVDCPAGTGDELNPVLNHECHGAVLVTNTDAMATSDARRAKQVLLEYQVPYLGLIENKSYIYCQHCSSKNDLPKSFEWTEQEIIAKFGLDVEILETNILPEFNKVAVEILKRLKVAKVIKPYQKKTIRLKHTVTKTVLNTLARK